MEGGLVGLEACGLHRGERGLMNCLGVMLTVWTDSCVELERRVQVDKRVPHEEQLDNHTATPEMRQDQGHTIRHEPAKLQGRRTSNKNRQRGMGFMLYRYQTIRRDLSIVQVITAHGTCIRIVCIVCIV